MQMGRVDSILISGAIVQLPWCMQQQYAIPQKSPFILISRLAGSFCFHTFLIVIFKSTKCHKCYYYIPLLFFFFNFSLCALYSLFCSIPLISFILSPAICFLPVYLSFISVFACGQGKVPHWDSESPLCPSEGLAPRQVCSRPQY